MSQFVHLHVHTQYSILDGASAIKPLIKRAKALGMPSLAITDHGNMFGVKEFHDAAVKEGVKPILGCEVYVATGSRFDKKRGREDRGHHLILLAKNLTGYHNLAKMVSYAFTEGYYYHPRVDKELLRTYHEGIICCSACLGGELPQAIMHGGFDKAEAVVREFKEIFGDDYYLEMQLHRSGDPRRDADVYENQKRVNAVILELAAKHNVKYIASNDAHFIMADDAEAHDRLICLNTGKDLDDPTRMRYTGQEYLKSEQEMAELFGDHPEALTTTLEIADKVEEYSLEHKPLMPNFPIPDDFPIDLPQLKESFSKKIKDEVLLAEVQRATSLDELIGGHPELAESLMIAKQFLYLKHLTFEGARRRYGELNEQILKRLDYELSTIEWMGFPGYFLIVQDFIRAAREELDVSVGPGRGSAAGSAVAYCLGITKIDPIAYDLLFERFLNPDRISLPDIDVDFDDDGRGEVLRWVTEKYGQEKVAHIITYGTMATKMAIKDVARVQKLPLSESDRLCKLVPDKIPDKKLNLPNAIAYVPELQAAEASPDPLVRDTMKYAKMLEGNVRGTGVHACGTIICRDDITDWVPVSTADDKETGEKMLVTQYEGSVIEDTGLIKMDFLGLKTLSIIKEAVANVRMHRGLELDIDKISISDPATYKLYCDGRTIGTFQFESAGMQKYLRELQPSTFEDLIAMNALYRPGPMDYIPDFIDRKWGRKPIEYDIPIMEKYLKDTYGITVYQEQVMLLSRLLADFTRGESDALRKAMGKKLRDKLDHMKPKFISGGQKNGHDPKVLEKIWADWEKFASYAFNKSHATCYSWVAYQTAFLKANYPAEYMAAVMSRSLANITDITKLMDECKAMGINTLGPDVNESNLKFTVNKEGNIRFGLGAVKGVGEGAVQSIVEEREKNGPFKGIFDFVQRVNLTACNKKNLECLALAGGFDSFPELKREQYFAVNSKNEVFLETLVRYGNRYQADQAAAANSLFGGENVVDIATPEIPVAERWSDLDRLNRERDLVGIYLSAHPLDEYSVVLEHVCNTHMAELEDKTALVGREITMGGIVTAVRRGISKNGNPYGIAKIEDYSGSAELPFFGNDWVTYQGYLGERTFLFIKARCQPKQWRQDELELKITSMELLPDVKEKLIEKITILIPLSVLNKALITELAELTKERPGSTELYFKVRDEDSKMTVDLISRPVKLSVGRELITYLKERPDLEFRIN